MIHNFSQKDICFFNIKRLFKLIYIKKLKELFISFKKNINSFIKLKLGPN